MAKLTLQLNLKTLKTIQSTTEMKLKKEAEELAETEGEVKHSQGIIT